MKQYDESYFRRWYANPASRITDRAERARKVAMVVAIAEFVLQRKVRSVLDIGCGEGRWQPVVKALRPGANYTGMDSSEYAVRKFGKRRNLKLGNFGGIDEVVPKRLFDVVVASDMIHYLDSRELKSGLPALADRVGGVAYLDFFTSKDPVEGDLRGMYRRSMKYYLALLAECGLHPVGLHVYVPKRILAQLSSLESLTSLLHSARK